MLKILVGVGLGFLLFTNPEARQITADLLRATANAIAPEQDGKTLQDTGHQVWGAIRVPCSDFSIP